MLNIRNLSLSTGTVPSTFKTAVIKPILKKPGLDPEVLTPSQTVNNGDSFTVFLKVSMYRKNRHFKEYATVI